MIEEHYFPVYIYLDYSTPLNNIHDKVNSDWNDTSYRCNHINRIPHSSEGSSRNSDHAAFLGDFTLVENPRFHLVLWVKLGDDEFS